MSKALGPGLRRVCSTCRCGAVPVVLLAVGLGGCGEAESPVAASVATTSGTTAADAAAPVQADREATRSGPAPVLIAPPRTSSAKRGRDTCDAATPEQIRRRFLKAARAKAAKRDAAFLKLAAVRSKALRGTPQAAALAARVYAMSVSEADRAGAYAGCVYELSMKKESGR